MARPIKDTPTLKGRDVRRFLKRMLEVDKGKHRVSHEELARIKESYNKLNSLKGIQKQRDRDNDFKVSEKLVEYPITKPAAVFLQ